MKPKNWIDGSIYSESYGIVVDIVSDLSTDSYGCLKKMFFPTNFKVTLSRSIGL